ncbi:MAG: hypothetical protein F7C33_02260 [Desulfurococcales archaeon]|nr:hypothetical protein [Desulfurococcales archaeon]
MCRMIALYADERGASTASKLVESLPSIARSDPLRDNESHCDGVGYIALWKPSNGWEIDYHRYDAGREACEENLEHLEAITTKITRRLRVSKQALVILHARKAPPGSPRGPHNAHPFNAKAVAEGEPLEIYLAHNGGLNTSLLAQRARLNVNPEKWVDSSLYTLYLAERLSLGERLAGILEASGSIVETALDVALLLIRGDRASLYFYSYINPSLEDEKKEYYSYYVVERPGMRAVVPSSAARQAPTLVAGAKRLSGIYLLGETRISP